MAPDRRPAEHHSFPDQTMEPYLDALFRRAAQRAFIICESFRRPAGVMPLPRFFALAADFLLPAEPLAPRCLAQRARAAAAILALACGDKRRPP